MKTSLFSSFALALLLSGCEDPNAQEIAALRQHDYVALSPMAILVPKTKVASAADTMASLRPNTQVLYCEGSAMSPRYKDGTALVVENVSFDSLEQGMTSVSHDASGLIVVRYLAKKTAEGWMTIDLSADGEPPVLLQASRYVGVVIMAFSPED